MNLEQIPTPALWADLDRLEANIAYLANYFRRARIAWRPQTKGIKVPELAQQLIAAGAAGITCAKLSEAEVMAAHGISDILIANQVVGYGKMERLAALQRQANITVAVDSEANARELAGTGVQALVEVNLGLNRCGRAPGEDTVQFAQLVSRIPGMNLAGLMAWEGHVLAIADAEEKRAACRQAVEQLVATAEQCRAAGLEMPVVNCGGSGTFRITAHVPGVTEIEAGGAVWGDMQYQQWGADLPCALFLSVTVVSRPTPERAVVDLGYKACNNGPFERPACVTDPALKLTALHAEHGLLDVSACAAPPRVGDRLDFAVGYSDQTVYCHEYLHGVRRGTVEQVWPISARGKLS